jgi:hypothetical protein
MSREKFEKFVVDTHLETCKRLGLDFDDEHKKLIDDVGRMLIRKWKDGEYKEEDTQLQWLAWQEASK